MNKKMVPWIISGALVVVLLGGGVWYAKSKTTSLAAPTLVTGQVKYANIKKTVKATGTVQVPTQYALSFDSSGKVTEIDVKVGDQVKAGQVLAKQDQTDAEQQVSQAQDNLTQAQLKLSQLQAPASDVSVIQSQNSVARAQASVASAQSALQTVQSYKDSATLDAAISKAVGAQQATLQGYKDNPSDLDAAITQATTNYNSAQGDLKLANAQLTAATAGPNSTELKLAQNQVSQAQTALATAQSAVNKCVITAPVDGTIAALNGQVGESPSSGGQSGGSGSTSSSGFITLNGNSDTMKIVVPVDEADISSVQVGQGVDLTLDAYSDKTFSGTVTIVSPDGTSQSGVTTFSVTVSVPNTDNLMRPGMSANVSIVIAEKQNVLTVPSMAVNDNGSEQTVSVAATDGSSQPERRQVKIGIDDGNNAEVISGLQEGDQVVIGSRTRTSSTNSSQRNNSTMGGMGGFGGGFSGGGGFKGGAPGGLN